MIYLLVVCGCKITAKVENYQTFCKNNNENAYVLLLN